MLAALLTGYGKSLIFQLLPSLFPMKSDSNNIVIVVCPLNSIIENQINTLRSRNLNVGVLSCSDYNVDIPKLDKRKEEQLTIRKK